MLDIKAIRIHPEVLDQALHRRGKPPASADILTLDTHHRTALTELQNRQTERNAIAKQFGEAKRKGKDTSPLSAASDRLKVEMAAWEEKAENYGRELHDILASLPNIPAEDAPEGADESQNVIDKTVGDPPAFDFEPKSHFELGEDLGMMNFEQATKISGARFVVLYDELVRLERALAAFMIDVHTREFGYREVYPPLMVLDKTVYGTSHLPKSQQRLL
jgi:seryl-tRNA synthetase